MGVLVITCPVTGREFSTGIHIDKDTFELMPGASISHSRCPHCLTGEHAWRPPDARLVDD